MVEGTVHAALSEIPDHRTRKDKRFPLPALLIIALTAMLLGANDIIKILRWSRRLSPAMLAPDGNVLAFGQAIKPPTA